APWRVLPGDDPKARWTGATLPRDLLPRGRAAKRGFIVTANNDPFGFTEDGRIDDDPYYYGSLFDPAYRASRIEAEILRLTNDHPVTLADVQTLQQDLRSTLADDLVPVLETARAHADTDPALAAFAGDVDLDALIALLTKTWDRRMARDSAGAL